MKKLWLLAMLTFTLSVSYAQTDKDKVKKTTTVPQKLHNTVSKHKKHKGYNVKHKHHGVTKKHKVDYKDGQVKNKTDK